MFRLLALPPEILLEVLENTDLVCPSSKVRWVPGSSYHQIFGADSDTAWAPPPALFLVNKAFYTAARKVFLERNCIIVTPNTTAFYQIALEGEPSNKPQRYAASEFFAHATSTGHLSLLRSLSFELFTMVDENAAEEARAEWLGILDGIQKDGGEGLNLRDVSIQGYWEAQEEKDWWKNSAEREGDGDGAIEQIRGFVRDNIWRFVSSCGPPMGIARKLFVTMTSDSADTRYCMRKKGEELVTKVQGHGNWGTLRYSLRTGDWVEEVWVQEKEHL